MKHNHISEEILWQYVDKNLNVQDRQSVEKHIQQCADCRVLLNEIQAFNAEIQDTVVQAPSMRFSKNVMEFIEEEVSIVEYKPLFQTIWKKMFASSFAAIILGLIALTFMARTADTYWINSINDNATTLADTIYGFTSSTMGIIVILIALWALFVFDKFFLSKRFG